MIRYILTRLVWLLFILWLIITIIFFAGEIVMLDRLTDIPLKDMIRTVFKKYIFFLKDIITEWNWNYTREKFPVWELFLEKAPKTLKLNFYAFFIYVPLGIILGIIAAVKKDTIIDRTIGVITLVFRSIPSFLLIFVLILIFGYYLDWLPPFFPGSNYGFIREATAYIIPIAALSAGPVANISRYMRGELIDQLQSQYLLTVRIKGLNQRQAMVRHAFKNCLVTVLPIISASFIFVISGSFFIEMIYDIQGLSEEFFHKMFKQGDYGLWYADIDIYYVTLVAGFYTAIGLFVSFLVDISYGVIDPRIRMGAKK